MNVSGCCCNALLLLQPYCSSCKSCYSGAALRVLSFLPEQDFELHHYHNPGVGFHWNTVLTYCHIRCAVPPSCLGSSVRPDRKHRAAVLPGLRDRCVCEGEQRFHLPLSEWLWLGCLFETVEVGLCNKQSCSLDPCFGMTSLNELLATHGLCAPVRSIDVS